MKCPFRIDIEFGYKEVGNNTYLTASQREVFPECITDDCPFYEWDGSCKRIEYADD